ncbi:MAG: putative DNA binding domain-containing protein [Anaerolineales bacterium]|nr:putative DNA binding domain-containing protein [Anaerolineales bacterium]
MAHKRRSSKRKSSWKRADLHLHTPASSDYQEPDVSFLDILRRCEERKLDIVAITDHNTVAGYRNLINEIQQLKLLENLDRIQPEERQILEEYNRLLAKVLVLPGFEFTATFGFHILAIFNPEKELRDIEHLLLDLNIPSDVLDLGSSTVGATSDVLTAYQVIDEAGGIAVAAHANSTNGVAMRGYRFGGQTKIAYTQDPHLAALEVTDLNLKGRRTTAAFFSGTKPEYPRRMHCIQGSDAHRLRTNPSNKKNLGIGDRTTDILLEEISFEAVRALFLSNDFARTRPRWAASEEVFDFVQQAREDGPSFLQDFHESITVSGGKRYAVIADVCALANANGGTLFVGSSSDTKKPVVGVSSPQTTIQQLTNEISTRISPPISCQMDVLSTKGKNVVRILVPRGEDSPYAVDDNKIYVRGEADTGLAIRDEIVQLVKRVERSEIAIPVTEEKIESEKADDLKLHSPRTGVEVVGDEVRGDTRYFAMKDLRNGNVVKNVTKSSARRLWAYAISQFIKLPKNLEKADIAWTGEIGILKQYKQGKRKRFDLAQKAAERIKIYFGVTEDGIHGEWRPLVGLDSE